MELCVCVFGGGEVGSGGGKMRTRSSRIQVQKVFKLGQESG